jgi:biotin carboxylase
MNTMDYADHPDKKRVLLLISPSSYRTRAFLRAADRLGLEVIQGVDLPELLSREWNVPLGIDFTRPELAVEQIVTFVQGCPVDAIISVDDRATVLAAMASARLGLPHNSPEAAVAARDKLRMRELLAAQRVPVPSFRRFSAVADPATISGDIEYPCVVKPTLLSGSRGVIRADDPNEFVAAFNRTRMVITSNGYSPETADILVERFVPGCEVALEGLLTDGSLQVLALFDKPDPLDGPFFEEAIYLTPSRLMDEVQRAIAECTADGAAALGLREGPVHAELRINDDGPWMIEMAGRSIGGLCSTVLEFGTGMTLEELIMAQAVGEPFSTTERAHRAVGVMMIPIPGAGLLRGVTGVEGARAVPGVTGVEITAKLNHRLVPLPEGESYLGFIFAEGDSPGQVEAAIRDAHRHLRFRIVPEIPLVVRTPARGS